MTRGRAAPGHLQDVDSEPQNFRPVKMKSSDCHMWALVYAAPAELSHFETVGSKSTALYQFTVTV